jgi:hypothetical protein
MNTAEKVNLLNTYYDTVYYHDDRIYYFNEDTINELFSNPWDALRATHFGDISLTHEYYHLVNGNIETLSDWKIDELFDDSDFQEWAKENNHIEADEEE